MDERPEETPIDEEQDVEGHKHHSPNVPAPNFGREDEDDDDVEAHQHFGAPNVSRPQVP